MAEVDFCRIFILRRGEISAVSWLLAFLCGFATSILSAWGVGGGTLLLLLMTLFLGVDQRTAQGINLLFFLPAAASALVLHGKNGYLDKATLRRAIPWAVILAAVGAWIATAVDVELLRKPFGVYLLASGILMLWPRKKPGENGRRAAEKHF